MLELKDKCVHPSTGKPYIKSSKGGAENSVEGLAVSALDETLQPKIANHFINQGGITHVFVVEFDSREDRDYYALKDPAHLAYAASLGAIVDKVQVVDFSADVFQ